MTEAVKFSRWRVSCDAEATKKAFAAISTGAPEACGCEPCRNFAAQRSEAYPPQARELFLSLGIDPNREAEIYHMARLGSGKHLYGGWFHFVGAIQEGRDASRQVSESLWHPDLEPVSGAFNLGFTSRTGLVPESFQGQPIVQVEFTAQLPWILEAREPE